MTPAYYNKDSHLHTRRMFEITEFDKILQYENREWL